MFYLGYILALNRGEINTFEGMKYEVGPTSMMIALVGLIIVLGMVLFGYYLDYKRRNKHK